MYCLNDYDEFMDIDEYIPGIVIQCVIIRWLLLMPDVDQTLVNITCIVTCDTMFVVI